MIPGPRWVLGAALRPWRAFPGAASSPQEHLAALVLWRLPVSVLEAWLALRWTRALLGELLDLQGPWGGLLRTQALARGVEPEDLRAALQSLPQVPVPGLWLGVALPLSLGGLWLHHLAWDHAGLWLVGGLKEKRGWRATAAAEAEALVVGAVGVALGCLAYLPGGALLGPVWVLVGAWFWCLRGFALAGRHGCEPWRGVAATLAHGGLLLVAAVGLVLLMAGMALWSARS